MNQIPAGGIRAAVVLSAAMFISACSSGPNIVTNSAPGFDIVGYQTFSFLRPLSTDNGNVRTILSNELIEPARRELEFAGLRHVETGGDLLVNFVVSTRETLQTRPSSGASIHHGRGRYGTWGGYSMSMSTTEVVQRTEGTVGIDIIDAQRRELVWEGAASGRVTDQTRRNRAAALDGAITEILARFP
ncbi:MAG: DUF4136 domain-containing protein [Woeseiaceae bacterium]|nr:DUF4136 domain-containing protein [Woeseiaceae bacterium]